MEYKKFEYEDDSGHVDEQEFQVGFVQAQHMQKAFGGVMLGNNITGNTKMDKTNKRVSRFLRTDQDVFVKKAIRAVNAIQSKNCFNIELNDVNVFIERCQRIQDYKYKSTLGLIIAGKYYTSDEHTKKKIINCLDELKLTMVDIVKYIRLLQKYKIVQ